MEGDKQQQRAQDRVERKKKYTTDETGVLIKTEYCSGIPSQGGGGGRGNGVRPSTVVNRGGVKEE